MSWRRCRKQKIINEKKLKKSFEENGKKYTRFFVSPNSDNRHYCWGCCKEKYCYETKEKARRAAEYNPFKMRIYYCELCCSYHTTCKLSIKDIRRPNNGYINITQT